MTTTARATVGPPESHPLAGLVGPRDKADPIDRVVALFSGPVPSAPPEGEDWSASLVAVRGVATRVRSPVSYTHLTLPTKA